LPGGGADGPIVTSNNATNGNLHLQKGPFSGLFVFMAVGMDSDTNPAMKSILVIDDNENVRYIVTTVLRNFGFAVREATSGESAIQMVLAEKPDLIISDVRMPGMDGHHLLSAIRELQSTAAIPFILMTGSGSHDDFRRGMASGADDYLRKPFTPDDLIEAVLSRLIRQTDLEMEAYNQVNKMRAAVSDPPARESVHPLAGQLHGV
jgi:two-component system sensor histidine kinase/response regulator